MFLHLLFVEIGFSLLDLCRVSKSRFKQLLIRGGKECRNKGKVVKKEALQFGAESWFLLKRYTGLSDTPISEFCRNEGPPPGGGRLLQAEHKHVDLRLVGTRRLITEIPGISPHYLPTKQSESHTTYSPHPKFVFKHSSLKSMGSLSLLSMSCLF